jgi:hypothetical protein
MVVGRHRLQVALFVREVVIDHTPQLGKCGAKGRNVLRSRIGMEGLHGGVRRIECSQHSNMFAFEIAIIDWLAPSSSSAGQKIVSSS